MVGSRASITLVVENPRWLIVGITLTLVAASVPAQAGGHHLFWWQEEELPRDGLAAGDRFGDGVTIEGRWIAAGAPGADEVHLFHRTLDEQIHLERLQVLDAPEESSRFGDALALDGDLLAVGAPRDGVQGTNAGAVHVYERQGEAWALEASLRSEGQASGEHLGWDVALDGQTVVAGAIGADDAGSTTGAAYVFERSGDTWTTSARLTAPAPDRYDRFGDAVAVDRDRIAVGASGAEDDAGAHTGAAHVFEETPSGWTHEARLTPTDHEDATYFGAGLDLDGKRLAVGALDEDGVDAGSGALYVFYRAGGWSQTARMAPPDDTIHQLGAKVALDGDWIAVGAPDSERDDRDTGAVVVHRFEGGSWTVGDVLKTSGFAGGWYQLGAAVDLDHRQLAAGAPGFDTRSDPDIGEVTVYGTDRDHDGLLWVEETQFVGTDPADPDTDGDLHEDTTEWFEGSNPLDPTSVPTPVGPTPSTGLFEEAPVTDDLRPVR